MYKRKLAALLSIIMIFTIVMTASPVAYAQQNNESKIETILSLDKESLLNLLEKNGLELPPDFYNHRELAQHFVEEFTPKLIAGEVDPYAGEFNYDQSNQMMENLAKTLMRMNVFQEERASSYTLQNSTAIGSWNNSYNNYNCYAYSLGKVNGLQPGTTSNTSFSMTMSISQMANVVLADLNTMGCWGYKTTTKPSTLPDQWFKVICIRKDTGNLDYHFMKMYGSLNSWAHKPGLTQPLKWNYSNPGAAIWTNEYVKYGVAHQGDVTYESQIYYIVYKKNSDPGIQPTSWVDPTY